MLTMEEIFWYSIIIIIIGCLLHYLFSDKVEYFKDKKKIGGSREGRKDMLGKAKVVHVMNLTPVFPNIVPLRDQVHTWIVKVPLTPFRAPVVKLPPLAVGKVLPPFLLYKMEYLTPVRNQGTCGSCWAFSMCDMLSDRAMIVSGGLFKYNLSVQQLLSCFDPEGCDGQSPEEAVYWLMDNDEKLMIEDDFPYKQGKGGSVTKKCPNMKGIYQVGVEYDSVYSNVEFIPETGYDENILLENVYNMKLDLYENGPFFCAMTVYDDLFAYAGLKPYIPGKGSSVIGGHAVLVVGFCDPGEDDREDFDGGYWVIKNSWGSWPTQTDLSGYFMIPMGSNVCGIESRCGGAIPKVYGKEYKGTPKKLNELRYTSFKEYME